MLYDPGILDFFREFFFYETMLKSHNFLDFKRHNTKLALVKVQTFKTKEKSNPKKTFLNDTFSFAFF